MSLPQLLLIGLGGAAGAICRFLLSAWVNGMASTEGDSMGFPWGIYLVNVSGCLLFGLIYVLCWERSVPALAWAALLMAGFCGAFTTFSTFSFDTLMLVEAGRWGLALLNVLASVVSCLLGMFVGLALGRYLVG